MRSHPPARVLDVPGHVAPKMPATERRSLAKAFWLAAAVTVVAYAVPYGRYFIYPFALLATWAHEMGHGITTLLVGGRFEHLALYSDLGGVAYQSIPAAWYAAPATSAGGLIGPAVVGGATVIAGSRPTLARWVGGVFAAALVLSLLLWVRNPFGIVAVLLLGGSYALAAMYAPIRARIVLAQLTGIQLCLSALSGFDYLFTPGFVRDGQLQRSDTQAIADALLLPYWFWGGLIAALSIAILLVSFWIAWKPSRDAEPRV